MSSKQLIIVAVAHYRCRSFIIAEALSLLKSYHCWTFIIAEALSLLKFYRCWTFIIAEALLLLNFYRCWTLIIAELLSLLNFYCCWTSIVAELLSLLNFYYCWTFIVAELLSMLNSYHCWTFIIAELLSLLKLYFCCSSCHCCTLVVIDGVSWRNAHGLNCTPFPNDNRVEHISGRLIFSSLVCNALWLGYLKTLEMLYSVHFFLLNDDLIFELHYL